jgi:hypothetical protein
MHARLFVKLCTKSVSPALLPPLSHTQGRAGIKEKQGSEKGDASHFWPHIWPSGNELRPFFRSGVSKDCPVPIRRSGHSSNHRSVDKGGRGRSRAVACFKLGKLEEGLVAVTPEKSVGPLAQLETRDSPVAAARPAASRGGREVKRGRGAIFSASASEERVCVERHRVCEASGSATPSRSLPAASPSSAGPSNRSNRRARCRRCSPGRRSRNSPRCRHRRPGRCRRCHRACPCRPWPGYG